MSRVLSAPLILAVLFFLFSTIKCEAQCPSCGPGCVCTPANNCGCLSAPTIAFTRQPIVYSTYQSVVPQQTYIVVQPTFQGGGCSNGNCSAGNSQIIYNRGGFFRRWR